MFSVIDIAASTLRIIFHASSVTSFLIAQHVQNLKKNNCRSCFVWYWVGVFNRYVSTDFTGLWIISLNGVPVHNKGLIYNANLMPFSPDSANQSRVFYFPCGCT